MECLQCLNSTNGDCGRHKKKEEIVYTTSTSTYKEPTQEEILEKINRIANKLILTKWYQLFYRYKLISFLKYWYKELNNLK